MDPALVGAGQNTPAHYMDPALQFVDASGNPLGITYNFSFQPTTTSITLPAIYPGTVLGTMKMLPSTLPVYCRLELLSPVSGCAP